MTKWAYLLLAWEQHTEMTGEERTWRNRWFITRPGATKREEISDDDFNWSRCLNDLGAEGWELVSERMNSTVVFGGESQGWSNVAGPILMVFTFKRPV